MSTSFLSLNDDCILEIFDRMSYDSLCSISRTNKRLESLANRHFIQKNQNISMTLSVYDSKITILVERERQRYCRFFRRNIQNVELKRFGFVSSVGLANFEKFVRTNCSLKLRTIKFSQCRLTNGCGEIIQNILENVETVIFEGKVHVDNGNFLKYFPSLKHLDQTFYGVMKVMGRVLLQSYPKLERVECTPEIADIENWRTFLCLNPNIKAVTWSFQHWSKNSVEFLQLLLDNANRLERLYIWFKVHSDFPSICRILRNICSQKQFNRLELLFSGDEAAQMLSNHGNELETLTCLKGIHLMCGSFPKLPPLVNVTTMQLIEVNLPITVNDLRYLEVLYIYELNESSWKLIEDMISYSVTLTKITIGSSSLSRKVNAAYVSKLNGERHKLNNARVVTIYGYPWFVKENTKHKLVKIKNINFNSGYNNENSPFLWFYVDD